MATVIVDAGPLVAYLNKDDQDHAWAAARFRELRGPLLTCEAALSEAIFLLAGTHGGVGKLLALLERGLVVPAFDLHAELPAIATLLRKYADVPMALADACLVRMAELHSDPVVFTVDSDFRTYRKNRRQVIPLIAPD